MERCFTKATISGAVNTRTSQASSASIMALRRWPIQNHCLWWEVVEIKCINQKEGLDVQDAQGAGRRNRTLRDQELIHITRQLPWASPTPCIQEEWWCHPIWRCPSANLWWALCWLSLHRWGLQPFLMWVLQLLALLSTLAQEALQACSNWKKRIGRNRPGLSFWRRRFGPKTNFSKTQLPVLWLEAGHPVAQG